MPTINRGKPKRREINRAKKSYQQVYQNKRWKALRKYKFSINPVCEICEQKGIVTTTQEIHHITPFMTGKDEKEQEILAFSLENLQSLCIKCHKIAEKDLQKSK